MHTRALLWAALLLPATAHAQGTPTGAGIPGRFGPSSLLATQTLTSGFGDNSNELDQLYARSDGTNLHIGLTGNLGNGNSIVLFLDTKSGGQNTLNYTGGFGQNRIRNQNGVVFDTAFSPDYLLDCAVFGTGLFVDYYDLQGNTGQYLGSSTVGSGAGTLSGGSSLGTAAVLDNSNTLGASTATTGLEVSIPLSAIGGAGVTNPIKVMALLQNTNGGSNDTTTSNQTLPGLPDTFGNLGNNNPSGGYVLRFDNYAGSQFARVGTTVTGSDLALSTVKWAYTPIYSTNNAGDDNHPPVVSTPTVYNGKAYVVTARGDLLAINSTATGTAGLSTGFNTTGRFGLDGAVTGRVTVKNAAGATRLYMVTDKGTIYMMDADTGANSRSFNPLFTAGITTSGNATATTASTPAVIGEGGVPMVYASVKSVTTGACYLVKVSDTATPANVFTPLLMSGATDLVSPSITIGGTRVQVGATTSTGGKVYTVDTSSLTVMNSAATSGAVKSPPVLNSALNFIVGDSPASGSGALYCYNGSNANLVWQSGQGGVPAITGKVDQGAFIDYDLTPNRLYVVTTTGEIDARDANTGANITGFPTVPLPAGAAPTGIVALLKPNTGVNGNLYIPTSQGVYVVGTATPGAYTRFPVSASTTTPSASGRAAGSVLVVSTDNGANAVGAVAGTNPSGFAGGSVYGVLVQ